MKTDYPWQINSVIHKTKAGTKTLGIDALLFSPKEEDEVRVPAAPLEMHEGYSRFKGTLIVKTTDKKVLTFNIPAKSVPYIHKKTQMLIEQNMVTNSVAQKMKSMIQTMMKKAVGTVTGYTKSLLQAVADGLHRSIKGVEEIDLNYVSAVNESSSEETIDISTSKAYTTVIKTGKLKNKIPANLLMEDPKNLAALETQKKWLEDNVKKYPANQTQIDGINEAIALFNAGKLTHTVSEEDAPETSKTYIVYESACKNVKPIDEEGRHTIYQVSIKYIPDNNLPFMVEVMNCMAPVDKTKGNEIVMSAAVKKQVQDIRLSEEEWYTMIDTMKSTKIMYENLTYPEQLALAAKISKENYESSKLS